MFYVDLINSFLTTFQILNREQDPVLKPLTWWPDTANYMYFQFIKLGPQSDDTHSGWLRRWNHFNEVKRLGLDRIRRYRIKVWYILIVNGTSKFHIHLLNYLYLSSRILNRMSLDGYLLSILFMSMIKT